MDNLCISRDENKGLERVRSLPDGFMVNFQIDSDKSLFKQDRDRLTYQLGKILRQSKREYKLQNKILKIDLKKLENSQFKDNNKDKYTSWKKVRIVIKFCSYINKRIMEQRLQGKTIQVYKCSSLEEQEEMFSLLSGYLLEKDNKVKRKSYIIYSDEIFSKIWLLINMIVLIILTFFLPYKIAFIEKESKNLLIFENFVLGLFTLDIILSFFTAFKYNDTYIDELQLIAIGYIKTWFIIDLISVLPFEYFSFQNKGLSQITKFLKILKILRLTRLIKISDNFKESKFVRRFKQFINLNKQFTQFFMFIIFIIILTHFTGCLWFFITKNYGQDNHWVEELKIDFQGESTELYVLSFYWAITAICTVGFGDLYPTQSHEKLFCLVWLIVGVAFYTYTLSSLTTMVDNFYKRQLSISKRFQFLNEINKDKQIDQSVLEQLTIELEQQEQFNKQYKNKSKKNILKDIPLDLTYQLTKYVNRDLIEKITIFHGKNIQFLTQLTPFFSMQKFQAGSNIYKNLDHAALVYFIIKGRVGFFQGPTLMFKTYQEGSYFGEIEVFKSCLRQFTVRALEDCQFLVLPGEVFYKNLKSFPEINEEFHYIALRRNIELKKSKMQFEKIAILNQNLGLNTEEQKTIDENFNDMYDITQNVKKRVNEIQKKIDSKRRKSIKMDFFQKQQLSILFSQQSIQSDENQQKDFDINEFIQSYLSVRNGVSSMNKELFKILTKLKNHEIILKPKVEKIDKQTNINIAGRQYLFKDDFSIEEEPNDIDSENLGYKEIKIIRKNNIITNEFKNYFKNLHENIDIENDHLYSNSSRLKFIEPNNKKQSKQFFLKLNKFYNSKNNVLTKRK